MNNSVVIDKKFYWELFKSTFLISAFTVGGADIESVEQSPVYIQSGL